MTITKHNALGYLAIHRLDLGAKVFAFGDTAHEALNNCINKMDDINSLTDFILNTDKETINLLINK